MEPPNQQSKKGREPHQEGKRSRFQIVKLEERIAPGICCYYRHGHAWGHYK